MQTEKTGAAANFLHPNTHITYGVVTTAAVYVPPPLVTRMWCGASWDPRNVCYKLRACDSDQTVAS